MTHGLALNRDAVKSGKRRGLGAIAARTDDRPSMGFLSMPFKLWSLANNLMIDSVMRMNGASITVARLPANPTGTVTPS